MGENSKIEWTHHSFNPWIGCSKVSAGCANCYAEELMAIRYKRVQWGEQGTRKRTSDRNWREPLKWNREAEQAGERRRVFCASLADVFEGRRELIPWRVELFQLIAVTPWLDWLLLTKRPEYFVRFLPWYGEGEPPGNVWLGTSVENQQTADQRIPHLLDAPAVLRFLSCEPLLGPVTLSRSTEWIVPCGIDWVIVGGESGHRARPCDLQWIRSILNQCESASVPCFVKQLGGGTDKRGDWDKWPADLRVREFPDDRDLAR